MGARRPETAAGRQPASATATWDAAMHTRTLNSVREILLPYTGELPANPSVDLNDQVTTAIEVMVRHNRHIIPVVSNMRPVGQVRLKDAFSVVGIRVP
jgi:CBS domain protein